MRKSSIDEIESTPFGEIEQAFLAGACIDAGIFERLL